MIQSKAQTRGAKKRSKSCSGIQFPRISHQVAFASMACSSTSPSTPLDGQLARLFAILSQPGMCDTFFKVVDVMFAGVTPEETDRFTKLFSLLVRYYNVSPGYLSLD